MNKDQVKGRIEAAHGRVREVTGRIVGDLTQEAKTALENAAGKVRTGADAIKEEIKKS